MTQATLREAVARALCKLHIRTVRRHDTPPDELEAMLPGSVDYAWRDFIPQADAAIATMFERLRTPIWDALAAAYATGATDVHNSWVAGTNGGEPDFGEAASDYAACVDPLTAFQQENSDGR